MNVKHLPLALMLIFILVSITFTEVNAQLTIVRILPQSYTVPNIGLNFTINVTIQNVHDLYAWEFTLYYPNDILNGTAITEGPFLKTGDEPTFFRILEFNNTYSNALGRIRALCTRYRPNASGSSGDGVLAAITFTSKLTDGPKTISLEDVKLIDSNNNEIPHIVTNSEVTVIPEIPTAITSLILTALTLLAIVYKKHLKLCRRKYLVKACIMQKDLEHFSK